LASGIAHNFNNIVGAILGYTEMAEAQVVTGSRPAHNLAEIRRAGEQARNLVDQILAFGRRRDIRRQPVSVKALMAETSSLLHASLPSGIDLVICGSEESAAISGAPEQIQQVMLNLCNNAAQAMDGKGRLEVGVAICEIAQTMALSHGDLAPGCYVRLSVSDAGRGMDEALLERIFEPFFTTRRAGTGLGLATVHGIIADHGGALNVSSRPGFGSRFEAYVAAADTDVHEADDAGAPVPTGQGETILLVEDDRPLMLLGEEMVASLGYEPVGFQSGARALANFQMDPDRFDLVLTDQVMPEITGMELALAVHRIRPEMPIILVTGQSAPLSRETLQAADICEVLRKPLLLQELGDALARHLPVRARRAVG
jgi:CheY-like chemotaxis protein